MNRMKQNPKTTVVIAMINILIIVSIGVILGVYIQHNSQKDYKNNLKNIQDIAVSSSEIIDNVLRIKKASITYLADFQNNKINTEKQKVLTIDQFVEVANGYYGAAEFEFQILDEQGKGYIVSQRENYGLGPFVKGHYDVEYTAAEYKEIQEICANAKRNYNCGRATGWTKQFKALNTEDLCFAYYKAVKFSTGKQNEYEYYTLISIVKMADQIERSTRTSTYQTIRTTIINANGYHIISQAAKESNKEITLFDYFAKTSGYTDKEKAQFIDTVKKNKQSQFEVKNGSGERMIITFVKMKDTDWYFAMTVHKDDFIKENTGILFITVIIVMLLILLIFDVSSGVRYNRKLMKAVKKEKEALLQVDAAMKKLEVQNEELVNSQNELQSTQEQLETQIKLLEEAQIEIEEARKKEQLQLETITNAIPGGFKISNNDTKYSFKYISPHLAEMLGYTVEEMMTVSHGNMIDLCLKEDFGRLEKELEEAYSIGDTYSIKYRVLCKNGVYRWIQDNGRRIYNESGTIEHYSFILDINEVQEKEIALKEANATVVRERKQYKEALTQNAEYFYEFDVTEGMIYKKDFSAKGFDPFRNRKNETIAYDEFNEIRCKKIGAQPLSPQMQSYWTCKGVLEAFNKGQTNLETEFYASKIDIYGRTNVLLSQREDGHIYALVICADITEIRKKEKNAKLALQDAYDAANRANRAKSDFLSKMSHDIRTPMNAIIGMTAIANAHIDDKNRVKDALSKILASSKHLLSLINEVLDMSKIESGKVNLAEDEFNLSDLVESLLIMIDSEIKAHQHKLKVQVQHLEHENVIGDKLRLQQVFINIMSNAIKYTPNHGEISLTVTEKLIHSSEKVGCYEFIFEDNGRGMTKEYLAKIFEPFSRSEDVRINKIQGTGLGMTIAKNIIQMMHGDINVESEIGKGSKFTVTLYLELQNKPTIHTKEFAGLSILVIDPDKVSGEATCEMLDQLGMSSEYALSAHKALEYIKTKHKNQNAFYAVIVDLQISGMEKFQLVKEIKKMAGSQSPFIILSAYDWSEIEIEARREGVDAFIGKPIFKSRIERVFKKLVKGEEELSYPSEFKDIEQNQYADKHILLVEDNEINREIAKEILGLTGMLIDEATDGKEAVDLYSASKEGYYDMVIMDIQMPIMNGYEATAAIRLLDRKDAKRVPIIAMSANAFAEDVQMARNAGMNAHLAKPIEIEHVIKILKKYLNNE